MSAYAGFDMGSPYPGNDTMRFLMDGTNLYWVGYYLPVADKSAPNIVKNRLSWKGTLPTLKLQGWGVAPIYVGKQHDLRTIPKLAELKEPDRSDRCREEGLLDGDEAAQMARDAGFPRNTTIYFDVERPWDSLKVNKVSIEARKAAFLTYYHAWADAVRREGFFAGVYCSHLIAADFTDAIFVWAVEWKFYTKHKNLAKDKITYFPTDHPSGSKFSRADLWQLANACQIQVRKKNTSGTIYGPATSLEVDLNSSVYKDPGMPFA